MAAVADWVVIADFSPGIHLDFHEAYTGNTTAVTKNGAASSRVTYGCTADRNGALVPLPGVESTYQRPVPFMEFAGDATGYYGGVPKAILLDAVVTGPVFPNFTDGAGLYPSSDAVYALYGVVYDPALGTAYRQYVVGKHVGLFSGGTSRYDFLFARNAGVGFINPTPSWPAGALDFTRGTVTPGNFAASEYRSGVVGGIDFQRSGATNVTVTAAMTAAEQGLTDFDTAVTVNGAPPAASTYGYTTFSTPNLNGALGAAVPSPRATIGRLEVPFLFSGYPLCAAHQGRVVYARRNVTAFSGPLALGGWHANDYITYTAAGDFSVAGADAIYGEEQPSPTGVLLSMSAGELLIVRHAGGGVLVRGDLDNPQVYKLPLIHSTGGYNCRAIGTPFGVFYGTRDGVVRWAGGDTTELVSPQLDGRFWVPDQTTEILEGLRGRFSWWQNYVMVPNGYMLNTQTNGWWRLANPETADYRYTHYDVSPSSGDLYAFRWKVQGTGSDNTMWDTYRPGQLSRRYAWKSQPLLESRDREDNYAEIELLVQRVPSGPVTTTVTVELTGYRSDGTPVTSSNVFTIPNRSGPQSIMQHVNTNFSARFVQVTITADSGDDSLPAPKIFSIRLGRGPRSRTPRT